MAVVLFCQENSTELKAALPSAKLLSEVALHPTATGVDPVSLVMVSSSCWMDQEIGGWTTRCI